MRTENTPDLSFSVLKKFKKNYKLILNQIIRTIGTWQFLIEKIGCVLSFFDSFDKLTIITERIICIGHHELNPFYRFYLSTLNDD